MPACLTRAALVAAVLAVGAFATGCGGDDGGTTTTAGTAPPPAATFTGPVASTPDATQPPPQATEPLPPETEQTPGTTTPGATAPGARTPGERAPGGATAPDEGEPIRVPARFSARGGALTPPQITVPPFLAVEVSVASGDGRAHTVVVATPRPQRFDVPAGARGAVRLPGLRAGEYAIELDGRAAGTLVVGGEAGP